MPVHTLFDLLAAAASALVTAGVYLWRLKGTDRDPERRLSSAYVAALIAGSVVGAYGFGTANLALTGIPAIGRSIAGSLAGAIFTVEVYKRIAGIKGSTGLLFVAGFATTVAVGRIGCLLAGLDDHTYGIATGGSWGWDFGDGIPRHPVALYESLTMAAFLAYALLAFARRDAFFMANGFYLLVIVYAGQRFLWEFLKPYAAVLGPLNLFHLLCLALVAYGTLMLARGRGARIGQ
ncbi:MAG: prolipoprotein diacylglyceryl transferase family protein [Bauldia sp.]